MIKNTIKVALILLVLSFNACKKDEQVTEENLPVTPTPTPTPTNANTMVISSISSPFLSVQTNSRDHYHFITRTISLKYEI